MKLRIRHGCPLPSFGSGVAIEGGGNCGKMGEKIGHLEGKAVDHCATAN